MTEGWFGAVCLGAVCLSFGLALLSTLAPVAEPGACVAHLALPADYAREGRIYLNPGNEFSAHPHLLHSLFAVAYHNGGEKPVTVLNWVMALLACSAVYALGRRLGGRTCGFLAAALLATAPVFLEQAGGVSVDLAFTAYTTAAMVAFLVWLDTRRQGWLLLAAFLVGSACGIRVTGYVFFVLLGFAMAGSARDHRARTAAVFGGVALLGALPWLVRSGLLSGNPFYPLFSLPLPLSAPSGAVPHGGGAPLWMAFLRFPYDLIMRPGQTGGWETSLGGLMVILGVPGMVLGGRRARWLGLYAIVGGAILFFFYRLSTPFLPFAVVLMTVGALGVSKMGSMQGPVRMLLLFAFVYGIGLHAAMVYPKLPVLLGKETRAEYLTGCVEGYPAFQFANERLNQGGVILSTDPRSYHLDAPAFHNPRELQRVFGWNRKRQLTWLREHNIRFLMLSAPHLEALRRRYPRAGSMLDNWRSSPGQFRFITVLDIPRIDGAGIEQVEFYEVVGRAGRDNEGRK